MFLKARLLTHPPTTTRNSSVDLSANVSQHLALNAPLRSLRPSKRSSGSPHQQGFGHFAVIIGKIASAARANRRQSETRAGLQLISRGKWPPLAPLARHNHD